nr:hypothetical protein [Aeromicrobium sp. SORGH_AS_0981]
MPTSAIATEIPSRPSTAQVSTSSCFSIDARLSSVLETPRSSSRATAPTSPARRTLSASSSARTHTACGVAPPPRASTTPGPATTAEPHSLPTTRVATSTLRPSRVSRSRSGTPSAIVVATAPGMNSVRRGASTVDGSRVSSRAAPPGTSTGTTPAPGSSARTPGTRLAWSTPSSRSTRSSASSGRAEEPVSATSTGYCTFSSSSRAPRALAMPVSTAVASVTPTSSDAVVAALRRGLRTAFAAASRVARPVPPSRRPASRRSAGTRTGPSSSTPVKVTMPPTSSGGSVDVLTATARAAAPAATTATPTPTRAAPARLSTSASCGRSAASGLTRTTRRVGSQAAATVTTTPPTNAPPTHRGDSATAPSVLASLRARTAATMP